MEHCAIDLGGRKSQICVRGSDGQVLEEKRVETDSLKEYLRGIPRCRVVMETCAEAFGIADAALSLGHEVRVVPATLVRSLGVGARKTKTDRRDAQTLSEVSCRIDLPSVHIPSERSREWKTLCAFEREYSIETARRLPVRRVCHRFRGDRSRHHDRSLQPGVLPASGLSARRPPV